MLSSSYFVLLINKTLHIDIIITNDKISLQDRHIYLTIELLFANLCLIVAAKIISSTKSFLEDSPQPWTFLLMRKYDLICLSTLRP